MQTLLHGLIKKALPSLAFFLTCTLCSGQVHKVFQGHCKKKDIEIITGDSIPPNYAIIQSGYFNKSEIEGTLEGLTKKQIRRMKTYGKWRQACHVFIAFDHIQTYKESTPGPVFYEDKVSFYVLLPIWEIEMIK